MEVSLKIRFYIDPETNQPHIHNHQVECHEVEEAIANPGEDRSSKDGSRSKIAQTENGRHLRVIYVPDAEPDSIFVVTAYPLQGKALTAYRRRKRRRYSK